MKEELFLRNKRDVFGVETQNPMSPFENLTSHVLSVLCDKVIKYKITLILTNILVFIYICCVHFLIVSPFNPPVTLGSI